MKRTSIAFTLTILFLLIGFVTSACSGSSAQAMSTPEESLEAEPTEEKAPSPEPNSSPETKVEPTTTLILSPNPEPTIEASPTAEESTSMGTALDGKTLLEDRCTECHGLSRTTSKSKTLDEWRTTVERMISNGANLNTDEQEVLINYLAQTYP